MTDMPTGPRVLLRSEETGGAVSMIETAPGPDAGPFEESNQQAEELGLAERAG